MNRITGRGKKTVYKEPRYEYDTAFARLDRPVHLSGYFQSERYFSEYAELVRAMLSPPAVPDAVADRLSDRRPFGVTHVRRGDYLTAKNSALYAFPGRPYYGMALSRLPEDQPVIVLSDDPQWAAENIEGSQEIIIPALEGARTGLQDLRLMSMASDHVIANSSFSWWGAWLAEPKSGVTIAPRQWFKDDIKSTADLLPSRWLRL